MSAELLLRHLRRIEVEYGMDGWHGETGPPPELYVLLRGRSPIRSKLPPGWWGPPGTSPGAMLLHHAECMAGDLSVLEAMSLLDWYGVALVCEAWVVISKGREIDAQVQAAGERRQLHLHPDRQTGRGAWGVTREQHRAAVLRMENQPAEIKTWTTQDEEAGQQRGLVIEGLVAMVAAIDGLLLGVEDA